MFLSTKAPTRGLGRATTNFLKHDNTKSPREKACVACLSTTSHRDALHFRRASSSSRERKRAEREQLTRLLKESPGKRDARNFLKQFDAPKKSKAVDTPSKSTQTVSEVVPQEWGSMRIGVNLGSLYQPTVFTREPLPDKKYKEEEEYQPPHLALVKLRLPQQLDDKTLGGLALTLSQMARLGLGTAVVLDCDESCSLDSQYIDPAFEELVREQTGRLQAALEDYNEPGAWIVDHAMKYAPSSNLRSDSAHIASGVEVQNGYLIYPLIDEGVIPIVPPVAYNAELKKVKVRADDVLLALIREFSGTTSQNSTDIAANERPVLDRIIVLDPLGGIPSENRSDGAHVFVNIEAEYQDIKRELQWLSLEASNVTEGTHSTSLSNANPISKFVEEEIVSLPGRDQKRLSDTAPDRHLSNLDLVDKALKLLPATSSGLILTPSEAATQAIPDDVRTLPSKNPLLHNMLTDKPMISSSLPTSPASRFLGTMSPNPATFLKKGIPLTMIPDPRVSGPWRPPNTSYPSIDLATDPRVDLPKLVNLINDSFRRTLDPEDYLERIKGRVAGVIIAGDYEGGAICTWESPSSLQDAQAPGERACWVPYLDKFAVLTASQGSGGVSDIVWAALTRSCFPKGLVWRSRTSNPVNKWYQERSTGMWNLPGGQWTMFWTTEGIDQSSKQGLKKWDAYVDVCSGIEPSWADGIKRAD